MVDRKGRVRRIPKARAENLRGLALRPGPKAFQERDARNGVARRRKSFGRRPTRS
jgi:hypothetical protein